MIQGSDVDLSAPVRTKVPAMLHALGSGAARRIVPEIETHAVGLELHINGHAVDVRKLYCEDSKLIGRTHLMEALHRQAEALDNVTIMPSSQLSGIDIAAGTIAVRDADPVCPKPIPPLRHLYQLELVPVKVLGVVAMSSVPL